ncbi:DUF1403 family protein [Agrobacterium vitis]|uniref:DUF1403 family protein n=1 Tax=Agrobacterium vitis TaxID=373 RepID=A0ABD6GHF1_AGRVI|nr:DUF1403 family protein [Agrobacterium vitis]MUO94681.1 DUF1403 family protein [Agrobacterium vitis]MUP05557.1 DUF1403 family protein [Agrobacterium vitis]MVA92621.1 DUF1403 family protein [Agrobacterium vitis]MVB03356.1 DUF1403 family protein [Agrobacterium vitis]
MEPSSTWSPCLPTWTPSRGRETSESDTALATGIAQQSLDDLIRVEPAWLDC